MSQIQSAYNRQEKNLLKDQIPSKDKEEYDLDLFADISSKEYIDRLREMQNQILNEGKIDKEGRTKLKQNQIVAKLSYSLIKRKANDLVEMMVDDELIKIVEILNQKEAIEQYH